MKIKVTQDHIDKTVRGDGSACMVHQAIVDAFPDADLREFTVFPDAVQIEDLTEGEWEREGAFPFQWHTPPDVEEAINHFDEFGEGTVDTDVKPFEFDLPDDFAKRLRAPEEAK